MKKESNYANFDIVPNFCLTLENGRGFDEQAAILRSGGLDLLCGKQKTSM